jgi:oligopeptidase B
LKDWIVIDERKNALLSLRCINRLSNETHTIDFGEEVYEAGSAYISEYDTNLYRYTYQSV